MVKYKCTLLLILLSEIQIRTRYEMIMFVTVLIWNGMTHTLIICVVLYKFERTSQVVLHDPVDVASVIVDGLSSIVERLSEQRLKILPQMILQCHLVHSSHSYYQYLKSEHHLNYKMFTRIFKIKYVNKKLYLWITSQMPYQVGDQRKYVKLKFCKFMTPPVQAAQWGPNIKYNIDNAYYRCPIL